MLSNSFLALGSGQIQLNMFPTAPLFIYTADMYISYMYVFYFHHIFSGRTLFNYYYGPVHKQNRHWCLCQKASAFSQYSPTYTVFIYYYTFLSFSIVKFYTRIDVFRSKNWTWYSFFCRNFVKPPFFVNPGFCDVSIETIKGNCEKKVNEI